MTDTGATSSIPGVLLAVLLLLVRSARNGYAGRVVWCVIAILIIGILAASARWQPEFEHAPPDVQMWFKQQHNSKGEWCCDESDGHAWYGDYTLNKDGSVTIFIGDLPHVINAEYVLKGPNPTGHAVWWYREIGSTGLRDYCFSPGVLN